MAKRKRNQYSIFLNYPFSFYGREKRGVRLVVTGL